jgi:hypothetical protein
MTGRQWLSVTNHIFLFKVTKQVLSDEGERNIFSGLKYIPKNVLGNFFTANGPGGLVPVDGMMNMSK